MLRGRIVIGVPVSATICEMAGNIPNSLEKFMEEVEQFKRKSEEEKKSAPFSGQFTIPAGETGYGYKKLFRPFLDENVKRVEIDESYIKEPYQLWNFLHFCDAVRESADPMVSIVLKTSSRALEKDVNAVIEN